MRFIGVPKELLLRCQQGDEGAFEALYQTIQADLYGLLWAILRNHDDVTETMQECLIRIFRHLKGLREQEHFPAWLTRLAVNQARTHLKHRRSNPVSFFQFDAGDEHTEEAAGATIAAEGTNPVANAIAREQRRELERAIGKLTPRQRAAIVLYEIEDMSLAEVANALGCSVGAVKFHLFSARRRLRVLLRGLSLTEGKRP